jgi:lipoprotein-anchoring transpeptidase ErfK/SrfK
MRKLFLLAAAAALLAAAPAEAAKIKFSPDTFQIIGGLGGQPAVELQRPQAYQGKSAIAFTTDLPPGSVLVRTSERRLYFILPGGRAVRYAVGVGREGFTWSGRNRITRKNTWPDWHPPQVMLAREHAKGHMIPDYMEGGPANPLGARAMYIGNTEYRIHGTNQAWSIGLAVSSGCIRMLNAEVIDLYNRVKVGAEVVVE